MEEICRLRIPTPAEKLAQVPQQKIEQQKDEPASIEEEQMNF